MQNIWRWFWYSGLIVVACVATIAQIDRHALEAPSLTYLVPDRFRNFALIRQAATEAETGVPNKAVADARRLVALHPIPAENLTILAIAEHKAGNDKRSADALTLAAQRGWREPLAQRSVALAAAGSGEGDMAADRLIALWKTSTGRPYAYNLTPTLLDEPGIRTHFAFMLESGESWGRLFLKWGSINLSSPVFVDVIEKASSNGSAFDCVFIARKARSILETGSLALATRLWVSQCGSESLSFSKSLEFSDFRSRCFRQLPELG